MADDLSYYKSLNDYERIKDYLDLDNEAAFEPNIAVDEFTMDFSQAIVVDQLPLVGKEKTEKLLQVIFKIYAQFSEKLTINDINMPFNDTTNTTFGFCFIKFSLKEEAEKAVQVTNGFELSKTNKFKVNLYSDLKLYEQYSESYVDPALPVFRPRPDVISWLTDEKSRDQLVTRYGYETEIAWANVNGEDPVVVYAGEREKEGGKVWCESIVSWSPNGTYLATYHTAGIKLWGGDSFEAQCRFAHQGVEHADFSPDESYLTTYRLQQNKNNNNSSDDSILCWDIRNGTKIRPFELKNPYDLKFHAQALIHERKGDKVVERLVKGKISANDEDSNTFSITEGTTVFNDIPADKVVSLQEPNRFKWSSNGQYLARVGADAISVYAAPNFLLMDKKSIAATNVLDFTWSPATTTVTSGNTVTTSCMLSYWAPASGNHPSLISIVSIPDRTEIGSRKLFDVSEGKMYWQNEGDYLCASMTKTLGKKKTYVLIFFRIRDAGIPVEQLELNEPILSCHWEPSGDRLCVVHGEAKNAFVSFYSMSDLSASASNASANNTGAGNANKAAVKGKKEVTLLFRLKETPCNQVHWSPAGEIVAIAFMSPDNCTFLLHDVENNLLLAKRSHDRGGKLAWDPSGRVIASCTINTLKKELIGTRGHNDDGYILFSFQGNILSQVRKERMYQLEWRPRPKELLSKEEKKKVVKNLKKYERIFEKEDKQRQQELNQELLASRRQLATDFFSIVQQNRRHNQGLLSKRMEARNGFDEKDDKHYVIEISTEEEIISVKEHIIQ